MSKFLQLLQLDVNSKTEKKEGLTYLSWSYAWAEFKKVYPDAIYTVLKDANFNPYFDSSCGAMVYTEVTAEGLTHSMWLPVMDSKNKAMKSQSYSYKTKAGEKFVEAYTMTDINKAIMRCLVKNLAMFGLGLYIYSGEDLPEPPEKEKLDLDLVIKTLESSKSINELQVNYANAVTQLKSYECSKADADKVITAKNKMKIELDKLAE